jgi:hypothetical protein
LLLRRLRRDERVEPGPAGSFVFVHLDSSVSILDTLVTKQIRELQADDIERSG